MKTQSLTLNRYCNTAVIQSKRATSRQHVEKLKTVCGGTYTVTLLLPNGKKASFKADNKSSIYDYAMYNNIGLPASCKQGSCTACVSKLVKGKVDDHDQCCIHAKLHKDGYIALCCAVPLSDVTIQTHQGPTARKLNREYKDADAARH